MIMKVKVLNVLVGFQITIILCVGVYFCHFGKIASDIGLRSHLGDLDTVPPPTAYSNIYIYMYITGHYTTMDRYM